MTQVATDIQIPKKGKRQFLYHRVAETLLDEINKGCYAIGDKLLSEQQLENRFGVSRVVVRQAMTVLKDKGMVDRQPGKGTFVKNQVVEDRKKTDRKVVGILSGYRLCQNDPYVSPILHALVEELSACSMVTILHNIFPNGADLHIDEALIKEDVDAAIILMPDIPTKVSLLIEKLTSLQKPLVGLNFRSSFIDCIFPNHFNGGMCAANHLLQLGHRHFLCLKFRNPTLGWIERINGFREALKRFQEPVIIEELEVGHDDIYQLLNNFATEKKDFPTAIFAGDDQTANRVFTVLHLHNKRIPEDVSVIGYNNLRDIAETLRPTLSTINVPLQEMATIAVQLLDKKLKGISEATNQQIMLTTTLTARESTGPAKKEV